MMYAPGRGVSLALYRGKGKLGNALVRWWTGSIYSHCELVIGEQCFSSSIMDGGVRQKRIDLDPAKWDVITLQWAERSRVLLYFAATDGDPYDWLGLLGAQFFNRRQQDSGAAFCSEWCAAALGLPNPETYSPETLGDVCRFLNGRV